MSSVPRANIFIRQTWRFAVIGAANTAIGLSVIILGKLLFELGDIVANTLGYTVGLLLSFQLNALWTFGYRGDRWPALLRYLVAFGVSYAANLAAVLLLIGWLGMSAYLAQIAGAIPYTICFFLISRYGVFGRTEVSDLPVRR